MSIARNNKKKETGDKKAATWQRQAKAASKLLVKWRRLVFMLGAVVAVMLIVWGYFVFTFVYQSHSEAFEPTSEQVGTYRLEVNLERFQEAMADLNKRNLY